MVTVVVVAPAAVVVVAPDAVVVVVAPAAVVIPVVAGAAVVVVQHGLVGKVGVKSMPNLASWLLLQSRQAPGLAGGGTYSMPTVSRMALITASGSLPLTIGWRRQMSSTSNLIPAANSDPDCCRSRGWGNEYKQQGRGTGWGAGALEENGLADRRHANSQSTCMPTRNVKRKPCHALFGAETMEALFMPQNP